MKHAFSVVAINNKFVSNCLSSGCRAKDYGVSGCYFAIDKVFPLFVTIVVSCGMIGSFVISEVFFHGVSGRHKTGSSDFVGINGVDCLSAIAHQLCHRFYVLLICINISIFIQHVFPVKSHSRQVFKSGFKIKLLSA